MQLIKISCKTSSNWQLQDIELGQLNLIVAKNATGKSRTVATIDLLVKILTQKRGVKWNASWDVEFLTKQNERLRFEFSTSSRKDGIVLDEKITIDDTVVLQRDVDEESVTLKNYLTSVKEVIFPPANKLTLHTNRDIKKYPYLEEIVGWAEQSFGFKFGNISTYGKLSEQEYDLLTGVDDIPDLYNSLSDVSKEKVIESFNGLGYQLSEITVEDQFGGITLLVKENDLSVRVPHFRLSQGMFRALSIIIFLEYLVTTQRPTMVIIDDLCEGLDYERATKLGELVFNICRDTEIQLIATSNDSFLMDAIDIKYWNILQRTGSIVTALNIKNSEEKFRKFKFTGLSNFDFFSSDYLQHA
jgi:hypothetical protein